MSTVNDNDLFIVERSGTLYKLRHEDMSTLNDTDLFVVERSGTLYKVAAEDVDLGPTGSTSTPVTVLTPVNGSGLNDGQDIEPLSSAITTVAGSGTITVPTAEITAATTSTFSDDTTATSPDGIQAVTGSIDSLYDSTTTPAQTSNKIFHNPGGIWEATMETTFNQPITVNQSVQIMVYKNNSYGYFYKLNGGSQTSQTNLISTNTTGLWTVPDPNNTSQPFTGTLSSFAWGLNTDFAGAGNTYWAAIYVDGIRLTDGFTTLTHSSDTNLSKFTTGTSVTQNSGHTPTTSAITSVTTNPSSQTTVPGRGTGSTLQNFNVDHIYNVDTTVSGWSTTITSTANTGNATSLFFWWSVDKVTWQRVYSRGLSLLPFTLNGSNVNQADFQYLIVTINSSTYLTNASVTVSGDAQVGGETILTLTDSSDLENFRAADTIIDPTTTVMSVEAATGSFDQSAMQEKIKKGICHNPSGYSSGASINTSINSSGRNKAANKFCTYNGNAISVRATYDTPVPTTSTVNLIGGAYSNAAVTITFKIYYSDGTDATINASSTTNFWTWDNDFSTGGKSVSGWEISGNSYVIIHGLVVDGASSFTVDDADYKVVKVVSGSNQLWTNGGTWSANDVAKTTLQAAPTGTVAFSSGSKLTLSSSSGRWITNANKTATKNSSYDTAITFADDTNLDLIIGTATQSTSNATDFDGVTTSAITNVAASGSNVDLTLTNNTNLSSITAGDQVIKGKAVTLDESASNFYSLYRDNGNQVTSGTQAVAITQNFFSNDETSSSKNGNVGWLLPTPNTNKLVFNYVVENVGDTIEFIYGSAHIGSATMGFSFSGDCTSATASFTGTKNTSPKSSTNIVTTKKVGTITATLTGPSQSFVHYIEGLENSAITVSSVDTSNYVVSVSGGTWSNGQSISTYFAPATIGSVEFASGSTLYGSSVSGTFLQGKYLRGATVTAEAPSPSEIVFTSSNAGTTAYSGSDSTLLSRTWKLESGSSSTGPWSLIGNYIDTGVASSQDGATQWATAPTLSANTYYRVGVTYVASNAADVASSNNIFKTGDA